MCVCVCVNIHMQRGRYLFSVVLCIGLGMSGCRFALWSLPFRDSFIVTYYVKILQFAGVKSSIGKYYYIVQYTIRRVMYGL